MTSTAGTRQELARYELPDGTERVVCAQRINGKVALIDIPDHHGRVYLIERHVANQAEMRALADAYTDDSTERGEPAVLVPAYLSDPDA